jgi:hypothetical protein
MIKRFGIKRSDHIDFGFWLVFNKDISVRCVANAPPLGRDERSMYLNVKLPLSLWDTPTLRASIDVASGSVVPVNIDIDAMQTAVQQAIGMDVDLRVIEPATPATEQTHG